MMTQNSLVTVVLTVYKRIEYVEVALQSVLAQTMEEYEIIIADDSGQQLAEPLYKLYSKDKRIRYQPNIKTLGIVTSLKEAIERSQGEFIAILNDDDCWEPEFLAKLVQPLRMNPARVLAFSDHWVIDAAGHIDKLATDLNTETYKRNSIKTGEIEDFSNLVLIDNGVPLAMAAVFRKGALPIESLVPEVVGAYDFWIACLLASTKRPAYYVGERLTKYRVHPQMETGRRSIDKNINMLYIYRSLLALFPSHTSYLTKRQGLYLYEIGKDNIHFGMIANARTYFINALKLHLDYRPVVAIALSYLPKMMLKKIPF